MNRPVPDLLDRILRDKMRWVEHRQSLLPEKQLRSQAEAAADHGSRGFTQALISQAATHTPAVIAEIKKASPSAGVIREPFDPQEIASAYHHAGAACLSVLTDKPYFQGTDEHLLQARSACPLPTLRKDFIVTRYQLYESRVLGADCVLLIVAALQQAKLLDLYDQAQELHLDVLLEVHNREELMRALDLSPKLLGINNRDLRTFSVSLDTTFSLLDEIPAGVQLVTESGIRSREDVLLMQKNGVNGFLVGESFLRSSSPGNRLRELFFPENAVKRDGSHQDHS